ncbi:MAG: TraR/DksA C4-type zinc finger protein [Candidatus Hydrogenedentes bacterium]|nr:TraR/DksA C4-type zinc finger protein [Candidatus Hydrogenedentota bacterium]
MKKKATEKNELKKSELKLFEKLLRDEKYKLLKNLSSLERSSLAEENTKLGEGNPEDISDFAETGTEAFDIEIALSIASNEFQQLQEIEEALKRIKNGTYGICEMCKKAIPKKRLEIIPYARFCVVCQSEYEKEQERENFR